MRKSRLEMQVLAQNAIAAVFPGAYEAEKARLRPFIGKKVFSVNGLILDKYKSPARLVSGTFEDVSYSGYLVTSMRGDKAIFKLESFTIWFKRGGDDSQNEQTSWAADLFKCDDCKIVSEIATDSMPHSYDLKAVQNDCNEVRAAQNAYEAALDKVHPYLRDAAGLYRLTRN